MHQFPIIFYVFALWILMLCVQVHSGDKQDWDFNLDFIEYNTTNPEIIDFNLRVRRVSRGVYGANGTITVGTDLDNSYSGSMTVYHSPNAYTNYQLTPFKVSETTFYDFMTIVYVRLLEEDLLKCSNLPEQSDPFDSPLEKGVYNLNECIITNDRMPWHINPGTYKAVLKITGENVEAYLTAYFKATKKIK